jgi:hypothetical protein
MRPAPFVSGCLALGLALILSGCGKPDVDPQKAEFGSYQRPSKLPGFIKVYPGGQVVLIQDLLGAVVVAYTTDASEETLQAFYRDEALKNGLEQETLEPPPAGFEIYSARYAHEGAPNPHLQVTIDHIGSDGRGGVRLLYRGR